MEFNHSEQQDSNTNKSIIKINNMISVSLSKYNTPQFKETSGRDWINYGIDNNYPTYLMDMYHKSSTHAAVIDSKIKQIIGDGLNFIESEDKDQLAEVMHFLKKSNKYETFNDILRKIVFDYVIYGGFALNLIWSNDRSRIASVHHVDFATLRVAKPNEETGEVDGYYFSSDWKHHMKPKFKPEFISRFNTGNRIDPSTILYIKQYQSNTLFYPLPNYISAMNYIELEYQLSNYQLNSIKNGLSPSLMLNFNNGIPTEQEMTEIRNNIQYNFTGSENAGRFLCFFNKDKDSSTEVTPIPVAELDKIMTVINENLVQNILTAHRVVSPALLGIPTAGQLGTSQELIMASQLFYNYVIGPEQVVIEEVIGKILEANGWTLKVELKDIQPISFQIKDEKVLLQVCTVDEVRKQLGYPPLTQEQKAEIAAVNAKTGVEKVTKATSGTTAPVAEAQSAEPIATNDVLRNLTGRQHQSLLRVIKQVSSGKLSKEAGSVLLGSGYGLTPEQIQSFLGDDTEEEMEVQTPITPYVDEIGKGKLITPKKLISK